MKSKLEAKILILFTIGILFAFSPIFTTNPNIFMGNSNKSSDYSDDFTLDNENPRISIVSGPIYINDNSPTSNWTVRKAAGICTGNGTYSEPYIIEDLVIDGGGSAICIFISNSDVYFRIENCTVFNSDTDEYYDVGIRLLRTTKGILINNNVSSIYGYGIYLEDSHNNTLLGNNVNNNYYYILGYNIGYGIELEDSSNNTLLGNIANHNGYGISVRGNNNTILGNIANNNDFYGLVVWGNNNTISENLMNGCGLRVSGTSHDIDTTNLVNGKPLYYYVNVVNLGSNNFSNAGQVILVNCNDSIISNLNVSYSSIGISLDSSNNNLILGNIANNNNINGISVVGNNNTISGNTANYNGDDGISIGGPYLTGVTYNNILENNASYNNDDGIYLYGEEMYFYGESSGYFNVSGNTVNYNEDGIKLYRIDYITISNNTASYNRDNGIYLYGSKSNTVTENLVNNNWDNGIFLGQILSGEYHRESNFNNVTENAVNNNNNGILLENCYYNTISENNITSSTGVGIILRGIDYYGYHFGCDYNSVINNILIGNTKCIVQENCGNNNIQNNGCAESEEIPLEMIILISSISGVAVIGVVIIVIRKRKRTE